MHLRTLATLTLVARASSLARGTRMPRNVAKQNLPTKICVTCNRPFTWRKKWERCWDEVTTCSKRCNSERRRGAKLDGGDDASPALELSDVSEDDAAPALSARKLAKKAAKAERRAKRQGTASKDSGRKSCDLCDARVNLLVRCRTDETRAWRMVCGGCWHGVSGGVADGDAAHPHYAYGGLWKNRNPQSGASSEAERADDAAFLAAAAAGA